RGHRPRSHPAGDGRARRRERATRALSRPVESGEYPEPPRQPQHHVGVPPRRTACPTHRLDRDRPRKLPEAPRVIPHLSVALPAGRGERPICFVASLAPPCGVQEYASVVARSAPRIWTVLHGPPAGVSIRISNRHCSEIARFARSSLGATLRSLLAGSNASLAPR